MNYLKHVFFTFFFMVSFVFANDVEYSFHISNKTPYEKEAVLLEFNLTQIDQSKVMLFKFSLRESIDYDFHQVGFKEHEKYHNLRQEYTYLVYPKKSGKVLVTFDMIKSLTDDDKVAYSISGDRDNVKGLEKEDVNIDLKPLGLDVKALPLGTDVVGDFTLTHGLDKTETKAHDPVNLNIKLSGKGFLTSFEFLKENKNYRLFSQSPKSKIIHSRDGSSSSLEWDYAISAQEDFTLNAIKLKAFNPTTQRSYDLVFPTYSVKVSKVNEADLLDKEDFPARSQGIDWNFWSWFFSYVVVFVAGLLMPRGLFKAKNIAEQSSQEKLRLKIAKVKTHKELLQVLLVENDSKFVNAIKDLESVVYNKQKVSLSKIKNAI